MRDLDALRVFETVRPESGHKYRAISTLLQHGVPRVGIAQMILRAPWGDENRAKWLAQLEKIASKTAVCPFCASEGPEPNCQVGGYMIRREAALTWEEVELIG